MYNLATPKSSGAVTVGQCKSREAVFSFWFWMREITTHLCVNERLK